MSAAGQRSFAASARLPRCARIRPCRSAPETGTKRIRGASSKGREPAIQYQQVPGSAKFAADRAAAKRRAPSDAAPHPRSSCGLRRQPTMHGQSKARLRRDSNDSAAIAAASSGAPATFLGARRSSTSSVRINAQHEFDQAMIQQRRTHLQECAMLVLSTLVNRPSARSVFKSSQRSCARGRQILAPKLPVEPEVVVVRLPPVLGPTTIDLLRRHAAQCRGVGRQSLIPPALHGRGEARQRRQVARQ